jgi:hypothetical protein
MGDAAAGRWDEEIQEAEKRGFIKGLRAAGNLRKPSSLFPADVFPVNGYPNIPPIVHRMIENFAPSTPFPTEPPPLNLPADYADFPRYFRELDARSIIFVLGRYKGKQVLVELNLTIDLEEDENDPEVPGEISSSVYLHHLDSTLPALIIGHIVGKVHRGNCRCE